MPVQSSSDLIDFKGFHLSAMRSTPCPLHFQTIFRFLLLISIGEVMVELNVSVESLGSVPLRAPKSKTKARQK